MAAVAVLGSWTISAGLAIEPSAPQTWTSANLDNLVALYRELHQAPELSFQEEKTAARLAKELQAAGVAVTQNVGGHGVVGALKNGSGSVLMLRTDLDALPVTEKTGLPYASQVQVRDERGELVGVMHACGHDLHITNLVGVARYLATHRDQWAGTVVFVGQPAEERGAGAKAMLADGLFTRFPRPDFAVAIHDAADMATGQVGYRAGYAQANVDSVDITIKGRGGHGAYPETTIDPIVIAARLVLDLQTIVSREIKPTEPAVITVGVIDGGTKHNIIPDECRLQLTVRSYSPEVRQQLQEAIRRKAQAAAASSGAPEPDVRVSEGTPALYNDPQLTARVVKALRRELGEADVLDVEPSMGGEDFSCYGQAGVPICMFKVGAVNPQRLDQYKARHELPPSLHSPLFYPDAAETLTVSVPAMTAVALELLAPTPKAGP
jgi:amidohydrolase